MKKELVCHERRHSLKLLGGMGMAGLLQGCCSFGPRASEFTNADFPVIKIRSSTWTPPFLPNGADCWSHDAPSIDVHAHFFNASDVNVKDYLAECIGHGLKYDWLQNLVKKFAPLVENLAYLAPSAADEFRYLSDLMNADDWKQSSLMSDEKSPAIVGARHREMIIKELYKKVNEDPDLVKAYRDYQLNHYETHAKASSLRAPDQMGALKERLNDQEITEEEIRDAIDPNTRKDEISFLSGKSAGGFLEFIGHMLSYRWQNLQAYGKAFTTDSNNTKINAVFSALVDFDFWLDHFPKSSREDQMKVHSLLSALSGGYMLPLIAYNPWTDIKQFKSKGKDESLELVKRAITEYGFIGVKIYPPMGFFPYGNEVLKGAVKTDKKRPDLHELDQKLEALFVWCAENDIPVMAHTNETMGRDDGSDEFGGPPGWTELLKKFSNRTKVPVINAAHFGGGVPPKKEGQTWPTQFAELMKTVAGKRFYADIGYWNELAACSAEKDCKPRDRIIAAIKTYPGAADRIMFGSDWFMLSQEAGWGSYAEKIWENTKKDLDKEFRKKLFYSNAISCFGLSPGNAQYEKITKRLGALWWLSEKPPVGCPSRTQQDAQR